MKNLLIECISERLGGKMFSNYSAEYKFEKIKRAKREAKKQHPDMPLIDMGVGEPDLPADASICDILTKECYDKCLISGSEFV